MRFIGKKGKKFIFEVNDNRLVAEDEGKRERSLFVASWFRVDTWRSKDERSGTIQRSV
jgi:hypothetical protein